MSAFSAHCSTKYEFNISMIIIIRSIRASKLLMQSQILTNWKPEMYDQSSKETPVIVIFCDFVSEYHIACTQSLWDFHFVLAGESSIEIRRIPFYINTFFFALKCKAFEIGILIFATHSRFHQQAHAAYTHTHLHFVVKETPERIFHQHFSIYPASKDIWCSMIVRNLVASISVIKSTD